MFMTRSPRLCTRLKTVHDTNYIHSFIWADDGFISLMKFMDDVVSGFIFLMCWWWLMIWYDLICGWLGFYTDEHAFSHHYLLQYFLSLYTFRDISSIFVLQAEGRGMGKHLYMLCTCGRLYYWPRGYLVLKTFISAFPLLSYCIAMQKRILNQTMMSMMVSECPVLNPHTLRRASVVVGRLFGDVPGGTYLFSSWLSPLQSFHGCICVFLGKHSGDRGCCIGFWVQGDVTLRVLILLARHWNLTRRISYFAPGWRSRT